VAAQIAVLLALTEKLFDRVPLDQMPAAERVLRQAAANIPAEVGVRFETADKLSDQDRTTIIEIARRSLVRFQPKAGSIPGSKDGPTPDADIKPKPDPAATPNPKAEAEEKS
jgi:F-type H+-transporting ATPase subunit alpha